MLLILHLAERLKNLKDSEQLNRIETYHQINTRISSLGYELSKVIYRGYDASKALQRMHEKAYRLQCKQQRTTQELELERQKVEHMRAMAEITYRFNPFENNKLPTS